MGLDMYLDARVSVYKPWGGETASEQRLAAEVAAEALGLPASGNLDYIYVQREAAYWRKANAIHNWFVENVQNGVDECQRSGVSREQLRELMELCQKLLTARDNALSMSSLPPKSGFFFGGTEVDEYYYRDLQDTVDQLLPLLSLPDTVQFEYHASW